MMARGGQQTDAKHVNVLLHRRGYDLFGRPVQPGVDDVHPGIAQRTGDDLHAAVVAIEPDFREQHADWRCHADFLGEIDTGAMSCCMNGSAARASPCHVRS